MFKNQHLSLSHTHILYTHTSCTIINSKTTQYKLIILCNSWFAWLCVLHDVIAAINWPVYQTVNLCIGGTACEAQCRLSSWRTTRKDMMIMSQCPCRIISICAVGLKKKTFYFVLRFYSLNWDSFLEPKRRNESRSSTASLSSLLKWYVSSYNRLSPLELARCLGHKYFTCSICSV